MTTHLQRKKSSLAEVPQRDITFALVGSPNSGKTTLFNSLTGLRGKTGNYPGVTVSRSHGKLRSSDGGAMTIEDLPGIYTFVPLSPDEHIVCDVLNPRDHRFAAPDGIVVVLDATTLQRSLSLLAAALTYDLPTIVVLTFMDDLVRDGGSLDLGALQRALGVPVVPVTRGNRDERRDLESKLHEYSRWDRPQVLPPTTHEEIELWVSSVLTAAKYRLPEVDRRTHMIDRILLHPILGTLIFLTVMYLFFETIFTVAKPVQDLLNKSLSDVGSAITTWLGDSWYSKLVGEALFSGVGSVLSFLPQIILLFLMIAVLEGSGYLPRAAFLMDRLMARCGLEGRAFVSMLSSLACAIPGIMATRSLPSARDRLATMISAPLMTCSARLPVYVLLVGMLVPEDLRWGPLGAQACVMFILYFCGALTAMVTAFILKKTTGRKDRHMPFYMEIPRYRLPTAHAIFSTVWGEGKAFVVKVGKVIMAASLVLWFLLNFPAATEEQLEAAGISSEDEAAVTAYTLDHSYAATIGKSVSPVFAPIGFDWHITIGVLASLTARETFVATMGQVAAAEDPEDPTDALASITRNDDPTQPKVFTPGTTAALLAFFVFALQCMSTVGVLRKESGTWKWPLFTFAYMFSLAWLASFTTYTIAQALGGA